MASAKPSVKVKKIDLKGAGPHNGEGLPQFQFKDPVNGEMIGGQVAAIRMAMRYPHCVYAWARRQGKTTFRMFLIQNEAMLTSGDYYAGICYPDHTSAFKIAEHFIKLWGPMVKDSKNNDKDQDRWVLLHPFAPPEGAMPTWFTPKLAARWKAVHAGQRNTGVKVYFWGTKMPYGRTIQGFPHGFHRIDWDEVQEADPEAFPVVNPMLRDLRGHECFSGTPWSGGGGNVWFERLYRTARRPTPGWFGYRIPDGSNPFVPKTNWKEALLSQSERDLRQSLEAAFLSDAGAVFSNLDAVFVLKPIPTDHASLDWVRGYRTKFGLPSIEWWVVEAGPVEGHTYVLSVDWARSPLGDYSVATVFDFTTGRQVFLARWRGENFVDQLEMVLAIQKHYGAREAHCDANGMGESMADFMRRRHAVGFVGHKFGRRKADYVRRGQVLFLDAEISLIDCDEQRFEFKDFSAFQPEGIGERQVTYSAPAGGHDDMVAAFLHLAPSLTISGKRDVILPPPVAVPLIDERGHTTLDQWCDGSSPFARSEGFDGTLSWDSVVLP